MARTVLNPESAEHLSSIVKELSAERRRLRLIATGDSSVDADDSNDDAQPVSTAQLNRVIDYPARDMTITVQAGLTWGRLTEILRAEQQQLPIDVADDETSVGAVVAANLSGPRRFGYGTMRDYLIGVEAVDGRGRIFHAGGRVVKNVAGYDLCRLLVGSRGRLGVLTQLTFKLKPIPAAQRLLIVGAKAMLALEMMAQRLNTSAARPAIQDFLNAAAAKRVVPLISREPIGEVPPDLTVYLVLGVEGTPTACEWQIGKLLEEIGTLAAWSKVLPRSATDTVHDATSPFARFCRLTAQSQTPTETTPWLVKLDTVPSRIAAVNALLSRVDCEVFGRGGNGVLFARGTRTSGPASAEHQAVEILKEAETESHGRLTVIKSSAAMTVPVAAPVTKIVASLKLAFDPHGVLSGQS